MERTINAAQRVDRISSCSCFGPALALEPLQCAAPFDKWRRRRTIDMGECCSCCLLFLSSSTCHSHDAQPAPPPPLVMMIMLMMIASARSIDRFGADDEVAAMRKELIRSQHPVGSGQGWLSRLVLIGHHQSASRVELVGGSLEQPVAKQGSRVVVAALWRQILARVGENCRNCCRQDVLSRLG